MSALDRPDSFSMQTNILISDSHEAQIADFGFSSIQTDDEPVSILAHSSSVKGTWRWMAPELLADDDDARHTKESDVWAYGCVLIEVCRPGAA